MRGIAAALGLAVFLFAPCAPAQVIEFESRGLKYQTLTHNGVTIMFAQLAAHVREYTIFQVAVSNGSAGPYVIRPEDFYYLKNNSETVEADSAQHVISMLMQKGTGSDVIKLVNTYETALYGIPNMKSTNGFETRRQNALAFGGAKLRAAATAAAVALVQTKLAPGESTDGAIFVPLDTKAQATSGHLQVRTNTDIFDFNAE
ncbi:MAG: hypothetical protein JO099_03660 [Acidobacteriia bacterium]|nr:hypothetical protein [Terriglobia bacterium]